MLWQQAGEGTLKSPDGELQGQGHPSPGSTEDHLGGAALLQSVSAEKGPWLGSPALVTMGFNHSCQVWSGLNGNPRRTSKIKQGSPSRELLSAVRMASRAVHLWTCLAGAEGGQPLQPGGHCWVSSQPSHWWTGARHLGETLGTKGFASGDESGSERFPPRGRSHGGKPRCLPECPVHTGQARRLAGPFPRP